ncbi:MAG: Rhodanese-related sulfurtransferase [Thermodesulfobacteria bacterium]|nr:rhodanese-like domain-containing protein [Thermodesulfobacteriota bacterium]MCU4137942.1 Rhodanese-related sulfurtransferase [Thermodesulfobacteriota bacterium]
MKRFVVFSLFLFLIIGVINAFAAFVKPISPIQAYDMLLAGDIDYLVDVRTPQEWSGYDYWDPRPGKGWKNTPGHPGGDGLEGKVLNISYMLFDYENQARVKNPYFLADFRELISFDKTVALLCHSGVRSFLAANELINAGYENVYNIVGGFEGRSGCDGTYCWKPFCEEGRCPGWIDYGLPVIDEDLTGAYKYREIKAIIPIPSSILLLGSGFIGFLGLKKKIIKH